MKDYLVDVCDSCLRASCWHGELFCEDYMTAGIVPKRASELQKLKLEHPSYYSRKNLLKVCGHIRRIEK